jgi:hypothetical protein
VLQTKEGPLILSRGWTDRGHKANYTPTDTLICKNGDMVEYNARPAKMEISEIDFKISSEVVRPYQLMLKIWPGRLAVCRREERTYSSTVDRATFDKLTQTIDYLRDPAEPEAESETTDLSTCELEIKFTDGQTRKVSDYGGTKTFGLQSVYRQLEELSKNLPEVK